MVTPLPKTGPKIYVGTYEKYNSGSLKGDYLYPADYADEDDFLEACSKLHPDEESPEFMFQDVEGLPAGLVEESYLSDDLFVYLEAIENMDDDKKDAYEAYCGHHKKYDVGDFIDDYQGDYTEEKWADNVAEERYYKKFTDAGIEWFLFDNAAFCRDLFINEYIEIDGHIFVKS